MTSDPDSEAVVAGSALVVDPDEPASANVSARAFVVGPPEPYGSVREDARIRWDAVAVEPPAWPWGAAASHTFTVDPAAPGERRCDSPATVVRGDPENPAVVYFPTRGGRPAPGVFPLVAFAHGVRYPCQPDFLCERRPSNVDADAATVAQDYQQWSGLLGTLARWGFVVVAPDLHWIVSDAYARPALGGRVAALDAALRWVRTRWRLREMVADSPLGLLGHSFGGQVVLEAAAGSHLDESPSTVGLLAPQILDFPDRASRFDALAGTPLLFIAGDLDRTGADPSVVNGYYRDEAHAPKHKVVLLGGTHWGYTDSIVECGGAAYAEDARPSALARTGATVSQQQAAQRALAANLVAAFFRRYLRDESVPNDLALEEAMESVPGAREPDVDWDT